MESMTMPRLDPKKYAKLLVQVLPRPITSEDQHEELLRVTSTLMRKESLTEEETVLLKLIAMLISEYERERYADLFVKMEPSEALAYLMGENHLSQHDFPEIPQPRISDILAGRRKISRTQAQVFGKRFKVNPALFLY